MKLCVALSERLYTNGVEWMIGLLKGKVCQGGGVEEIIERIGSVREFLFMHYLTGLLDYYPQTGFVVK